MVRSSPCWCLVVPVKRLATAKTRLAPLAGPHRAALALAFAADTVRAARDCPPVVLTVAVTDDPVVTTALRRLGALVVPDSPGAGLNAALRHGAAVAARVRPGCAVGALSADLPALRSTELASALAAGGDGSVTYVADSSGRGTTLLLACNGALLRPRFGPGSAAAHAAWGAVALTPPLPTLRRDVDTPADLRAAAMLGLGRHTAAVLAGLTGAGTRGRRPARRRG